jgi:hypothetical protein
MDLSLLASTVCFCPCTDDCPCRCECDDQRAAQQVIRSNVSRYHYDLGKVALQPATGDGSRALRQVNFSSQQTPVASALARCVSLSRFAL